MSVWHNEKDEKQSSVDLKEEFYSFAQQYLFYVKFTL
jgi:hypothetical protein